LRGGSDTTVIFGPEVTYTEQQNGWDNWGNGSRRIRLRRRGAKVKLKYINYTLSVLQQIFTNANLSIRSFWGGGSVFAPRANTPP